MYTADCDAVIVQGRSETIASWSDNPKNPITMKAILLSLACMLTGLVQGQSDRWPEILETDPYLSNGYFIIDQDKLDLLDIDHVDVDINVRSMNSNGSATVRTVQTLHITNGQYGHADMDRLQQTMQSGESAYYHLQAKRASGTVVVDIQADCPGCGPMPEACRQTCLSNNYSWAIAAYHGNGQATMSMMDGTVNGSLDYFYVKASDWPTFKLQYLPSEFGIPTNSSGWDQFFQPGVTSTEVFKVNPAPSGARQMDGASLGTGYTGEAYAIAKHKWPWPPLETGYPLMIDNTGTWCSSSSSPLMDLFNANGNVQTTLSNYGADPISCQAVAFSGGEGLEWGGVFVNCTAIQVISETDENGNVDILGWMITLTECAISPVSAEPYQFSDVSSLVIDHTGSATGTHVLQVNMDGVTDPRLVRVPKTTLAPGLYEFKVILKNGQVLRHFEDFTSPITLNSKFDSFVEETIYPVPVKSNRFAVDMDLLYPMAINFTVLDNTGNTMYTATWQYAQAGRHKEVITMDPLWNNGLYHAIFQFPDGSSDSKNFTIAH